MTHPSQIVVIIPDAETDLTLKVVRCLGQDRNFAPVLITRARFVPAKYSKYCYRAIYYESFDEESLVAYIGRQHEGKYSVILPVTLDGFQFVSKNRVALSRTCMVPPIPEYHLIRDVSDKWKLYGIAKSNGLPVLPSYSLDESVLDSVIPHEVDLPLLLKSRNRKGGFGFQVIRNRDDLTEVCRRFEEGEKNQYFVQPFVDGIDYSLSVFCAKGEIVAYTLWRAVSYGRRKYSIPTVVQFIDDERIVNVGRHLMRILQWEGVADIDFFVERNGKRFWLLEINARFWQTVLACAAAGLNFPVLQCLAALGESRPMPRQIVGTYYARPSGVRSMVKTRAIRVGGLKQFFTQTAFGEMIADPLPEIAQELRRLFA
jgi:D-aspartate ligase